MPTSSEFTCADCGETYNKAWSDEEAHAEREENFPGLRQEDAVVVCDDCYRNSLGLPPREKQS
jgi:hypothetical protein